MKSDVNRLPSTLVQMPPVTTRLKMLEKGILSRLTKRGEGPPPNVAIFSCYPGKGPTLSVGRWHYRTPCSNESRNPALQGYNSECRTSPVTGSNATIIVQPPPPTTLLLSASTATSSQAKPGLVQNIPKPLR